MSIIRKAISVWAIGRTVSNVTPLFMRLVISMAAITALVIVAALLISMLIVGGLWFTYTQLLASGIPPHHAALVLAGILLALLGTTVIIVQRHLRRAQTLSKRILYMQSPISSRVSTLVNAFIDGLAKPVHIEK